MAIAIGIVVTCVALVACLVDWWLIRRRHAEVRSRESEQISDDVWQAWMDEHWNAKGPRRRA